MKTAYDIVIRPLITEQSMEDLDIKKYAFEVAKDAKVAMALMENTPKAGCELMIKVLKSAMANAENNFEMDPEKLYVCETYANAGPILKRGMPRAQGRMYRINKRTSHIMIAVAERD